jgi:heat-inducible transcriptional repressor
MTKRQGEILAEIVRLYADSAEPVSSRELANSFGLSSATMRAEMSALEEAGYIFQPHVSSGRVPTDAGYRYFVNEISTTPAVPKRSIQTISKRVDSLKDRTDGAIKIAAETLSEMTGNMAFATLSDSVYFHGMSQLFSQPEFVNMAQVSQAARFLDAMQGWLQSADIETMQVYIGQENPIVRTSGLTMIVNRFQSPYSDRSYIGIVGPTRQSYEKVLNLVEGTSKALQEAFKE